MVDKNTFTELLHAVQKIAEASDKPMEKAAVLAYFKDMELSPEQEEMIYQFLLLPKSETEARPEEEADCKNSEEAEEGRKTVGTGTESSALHFQMYLNELEEITELEAEAEEALYRRLLAGDRAVIGEIAAQWLKRVMALAEEYRDRGCLLDDLVQEGNLGLLMELNELGEGQLADTMGQQILEEVRQRLKTAVRAAVEEYLREESGEEQQNETILGKVSLVHQAREFLTEEKGEPPSLRELSEYTRIPVKEVSDILSLIKKKQS